MPDRSPDESQSPLEEPIPEWVAVFREHSIPISGLLVIFLLLSVLSHFWSGTGWSKAKDITDVLQNVAQTVALGLGAWWFVFRYDKSRTFQESLIPLVSGRITTVDGRDFLEAIVKVKNVGQSLVVFAPGASYLRIYGYIGAPTEEIVTVKDKELAQFEALDEDSIEPNEIIHKTRFISLPINPMPLAFRLELHVISNHRMRYSWGTSSVVEKSASHDMIKTLSFEIDR